jgi:tripartite motif-containing protein 71
MKRYLTHMFVVLALGALALSFAPVTAQAAPGDFVFQFGSGYSFSYPTGIAIGQSGQFYVADTGNNRVQVFTANGNFIKKWGSFGAGNGQLNFPSGIAVDAKNNVYVSDAGNHRIQVFNANGALIRTWGTLGTGDGQFGNPAHPGIASPWNVKLDSYGNVYVADVANERIEVFTANGTFIGKFGSPNTNHSFPPTPVPGEFLDVYGMAVDANGNVYVTEASSVQVFDNKGNFLFLWGSWGQGPGQFDYPGDLVIGGSGAIYVAGWATQRIDVFTGNGTFLTSWLGYGTGNGQFAYPVGVAVNGNGNFYVTDTQNHRIQVFDNRGTFLRKWGSYGSGDGQFKYPQGVAFDASGNVYVADSGNNRIQVFDANGTLLRKWDGSDTGVAPFFPVAVAVDSTGNVYVTDNTFFAARVLVFDTTGTTLRGAWDGSNSSTGPFVSIEGIAVDGNGRAFVADDWNSLLQVFNSNGNFITTWGTPFVNIGIPFGVAVDGSGNVYVSDLIFYGTVFDSSGNQLGSMPTNFATASRSQISLPLYSMAQSGIRLKVRKSDLLYALPTSKR